MLPNYWFPGLCIHLLVRKMRVWAVKVLTTCNFDKTLILTTDHFNKTLLEQAIQLNPCLEQQAILTDHLVKPWTLTQAILTNPDLQQAILINLD